MFEGSDSGGSYTKIRIQNSVTRFRQSEHKALHKSDGKLAWMFRFLNVVELDVGDVPDVGRILSEGVAGDFSFVRPFEVLLERVLRGHSHGIQVEVVVLALCEPEDGFMPA